MENSHQPNTQESGCIKAAAQILGAKWTPQLLYAMCHSSKRFGELQKEVEGVNPRTLSARLDELELQGVVCKKSFAEVPPRIEYSLTEKGKDLIPIFQLMVTWSTKHAAKDGTCE